MTKAIETGMPKLRIEESAAKRQARIDSGKEVIVGVNKYRPKVSDKVDVRVIDNASVRNQQIASIKNVKATRDAKVQEILEKLTACAHFDDGKYNLLDLAIQAARARATVGEISDSLEKIWGRYSPKSYLVSGAYASSHADQELVKKVQTEISGFLAKNGRRPRILVAKMGQDGHDRGAKVIATGFADLGYDVDVGPLFQTPEEVVRQAIDSDVHCIGVSSLAAGHRTLVPALMSILKSQGISDVTVICGGVIPPQDYEFLKAAGVDGVFGPGSKIPEAALEVLHAIQRKQQK